MSETDIPVSGEVTPSINEATEETKAVDLKESGDKAEIVAPEYPKKEVVSKKEKPVKVKKPSKEASHTICSTMLSDADRDLLLGLISSFGHAKYSNRLTAKVDIVVAGESVRSVKMMCAVGRGIPVVNPKWLYACLEKGEWVDTAPFIDAFAEEGLTNRRKCMKGVLSESGSLFVSQNTVPPRSDLVNIIRCCDGKITENMDEADLIIGKVDNHEYVKETYILDGAIKGTLPRISEYIVKKDEESDEF